MCSYPRALRILLTIKQKSFSLIEVLVATAISVVIFGAIFMVLNMGEFSNRVGAVRIDLQQEVRRALDWMIRDFRQTNTTQMTVGGGSAVFSDLTDGDIFTDPQFFLCSGYNTATSTVTWGDEISYSIVPDPADPPRQMIVRNNLTTGTQLIFRHITGLVFSKLAANQLSIDITGQRVAPRSPPQNLVLSEYVRLRNN